MPFVHGKDTKVLVDQYDLSPYFDALNAVRNIQAVRVTNFGNDGSHSYIAGIEDGSIALGGIGDFADDAVDEILAASFGNESIITACPGGYATLGNTATMLKAERTDYGIRSSVSDAVRIQANAIADGGVRNGGRILHPLEAETGTENGTGVDGTASSTFGGVAHLHVTAFTGTNCTVKVQHSTDNSTFADLVTFTSVTGVTSERVLTTGTVNRYLRYAITGGTFSSVTLLVAYARNKR